MNQTILIAVIISVIFFLIKFIKMRFIDRESEPIKELVKETGYVFLSALLGGFLMEQFKFNNILDTIKEAPTVFTNEPGF